MFSKSFGVVFGVGLALVGAVVVGAFAGATWMFTSRPVETESPTVSMVRATCSDYLRAKEMYSDEQRAINAWWADDVVAPAIPPDANAYQQERGKVLQGL